jgi:sodium transport system permease protein
MVGGRVGVVLCKEIVDNVRDRRSLMAALFYPLLGPVLMIGLLVVVGRTLDERTDRPFELPVIGIEEAPDLAVFLGNLGIDVVAGPADEAAAEAAVKAGDLDVVVIVPAGYRAAMAAGRPATVRVVIDASRNDAAVDVGRALRLLEGYGRQVGALRLLARGIDPGVVDALAVERVDVSTPQSQAARLLNLLPYFLIFSVFIGGMYLAIDATAGERERGSLEPLLINPIARWELVTGKLLATMVFTLLSVVETLVAFALLLGFVPLEESLGVRLSLEPGAVLAIFAITLPMILLAVPLQFIVATFTRSFKEAQNYLSFLPLVPALPGTILAFMPVKPTWAAMAVPTFGQQILINQVLRGEVIRPAHVALSAAVTATVGVLLVAVAVRLYARERILFGR